MLWQRRRFLALVTGIGVLLAIGYSLLLPNQYESTAQLMPPDQQSLSGGSLLSALTGAGPVASMGGLISTTTPGAVFIGILNSRTAQDDIINRLDLLRIYHCKFHTDCRRMLAAQTAIKEDSGDGIISITIIDTDRNRARDLAEAYVEELDKLVNSSSTSSARREREFLEQRLKSIKTDLDANSRELSQFSSHNAILNPQSQGQSLIESVARLQGELVTAQTELSGMKAQYTDDNVRVREARARVDELQNQLRKVDSTGGDVDAANLKPGQEYPSLRELPILGVTYSDLSRQLMMQESIYETLTRQYEVAKVEEAKEIPPVKILDEPEVAERKSLPHRLIIVLLGTALSALGGITWVLASALRKNTKEQQPERITQESHPAKTELG
jgi:uncharacterized protein involved in exopolysaccharide biosynthesis